MASAREQLMQELAQTPDFVVQEVLDFLLFIKLRLKHRTAQATAPESPHRSTLPSFLQFAEDVSAQIPKEEWEKLPTDLSKNVDYYLYGSPKTEE